MTSDRDIYDGAPWSEIDIRDLADVIGSGGSVRDAAEFLCRSGTEDDVAGKCEELGLRVQRHEEKN
jgi:hypothetical protein